MVASAVPEYARPLKAHQFEKDQEVICTLPYVYGKRGVILRQLDRRGVTRQPSYEIKLLATGFILRQVGENFIKPIGPRTDQHPDTAKAGTVAKPTPPTLTTIPIPFQAPRPPDVSAGTSVCREARVATAGWCVQPLFASICQRWKAPVDRRFWQ